MKFDKDSLLLYAVTDRHWLKGRSLKEDVESALKGGASFIQLREKEDMVLDHDAYLQEALEIGKLCRSYSVPFVLDDEVELAIDADADGVHVGQEDMEAGRVREKLGKEKILGVSVQTVEEAILAKERGADYLGVGAVFPTGSKKDAVDVSLETLKAISEAVDLPVVAIGGISRDNVMELKGSGIAGIAVISAIFAKPDIEEATADLRKQCLKMLFPEKEG